MEERDSRHLLAEIEAAAARSWPALETADIGGWLWRYAMPGGWRRTNSVSTLAFHAADFDAAVHEVERRYRARAAPCWFTITDASRPTDIDARLAALGYARGEDHVTMAKPVDAAAPAPGDMLVSAAPTPEWLAVYLADGATDRHAAAPAILAGLPPRRAFMSCRRGGVVVGSGLSVADGVLASVQCMATRRDVRRQGCARSVLSAIEAWAAAQGCTHLYLQAEAANAPAIDLYKAAGFQVAGRYHVRVKE